MPALPHVYFAYGSNLYAPQMAQRCPDAIDPRPAALADHRWLINQRGAATIEASVGSCVHGLLWRLCDRDLATLDYFEGVPVHYCRAVVAVHTAGGPLPAWVYIDQRVQPGTPRPGYLERVVDGAVQHGLPQSWIDFLRGWNPAKVAAYPG